MSRVGMSLVRAVLAIALAAGVLVGTAATPRSVVASCAPIGSLQEALLLAETVVVGSVTQLETDTRWATVRVEERLIDVQELLDDIRAGKVTEAFGSGTAAVITPVGSLGFRDECLTIGNGGVGALTSRLYDTLTGIQTGAMADPFGWVRKIA